MGYFGNKILNYFRFTHEAEEYDSIYDTIEKGVVFSGTNLLVLVFAIFVASVGLNVNSTAVIIGAMLISPLMGPIMGAGLGLGVYNISLLRLSIKNLGFSVLVSLGASTVYFLITPLNQAHSELFARTSPNIYDVLIAFFGGLAGITAITSKQKGNALQGAAIATALMPPLCTAGYGIATLQAQFFFGAFYLFIINSVFICLATYLAVKFLDFPKTELALNPSMQKKLRRMILGVVILTLVPSIYLGYRLSKQESFNFKASKYVEVEFGGLQDSYVLKSEFNFSNKKIFIILGGKELSTENLYDLKRRLPVYGLDGAELVVKTTLSFQNKEGNERLNLLNNEISYKNSQIYRLQQKLDSIEQNKKLLEVVGDEIVVLFPDIESIHVSKHGLDTLNLALLSIEGKPLSIDQMKKISDWLKIRLSVEFIEFYFKKSLP
jgi:uncharacterized hydrophobic protein (TIGR00271 family)